MQAQLANDPDFQYLAVDRVKLLKEQTKEFDGKKMCWIPDHKEGFLKAEIQSTKGDDITVKCLDTNEVQYIIYFIILVTITQASKQNQGCISLKVAKYFSVITKEKKHLSNSIHRFNKNCNK